MGGANATHELTQLIASVWIPFINSKLMAVLTGEPLLLAIVGSLAGAAGGAWGAQRIAERGKKRDELVKELRSINAAIAVAHAIANGLLGLKKQHLRDLKAAFDADVEGYQQHGAAHHLAPNFMSLQIQTYPTDILRSMVFERISLVGRPLSLTLQLITTLEGLNGSMAERHRLINAAKPIIAGNPNAIRQFYLGVQSPNGEIDMRYPHTMQAVSSQCDDGIHFAQLLVSDLAKFGQKIGNRYRQLFPKDPKITVTSIDYSIPRSEGLFPDVAPYSSWETGFKSTDTSAAAHDGSVIHKN